MRSPPVPLVVEICACVGVFNVVRCMFRILLWYSGMSVSLEYLRELEEALKSNGVDPDLDAFGHHVFLAWYDTPEKYQPCLLNIVKALFEDRGSGKDDEYYKSFVVDFKEKHLLKLGLPESTGKALAKHVMNIYRYRPVA